MTTDHGPVLSPSATLYLWPQRTLYLGFIGPLSALTQGAHTLLVGLDDAIPFTVGAQTVTAGCALVPAGLTFSAEAGEGRIACWFLDPLGRDLRFHQSRMHRDPSGLYLPVEPMEEARKLLVGLFETEALANQAYTALQGVLFPAESDVVLGFEFDERVRVVIERIRQDPTDNLSNDALAETVGLSGDRLQRLFKDATGIPIRRYRLWHRLFVTSTMMAMGSSLTEAALAAGFSDSSHLTNVFRNMLGMSPSTVLRRSRQIRILVGSEPE